MSIYKQHFDLAIERFQTAEEQFNEERYQTAAHLFINAAINFHNAVCQKFLNKIPSHKQHSDSSYFNELLKFLGKDFAKYKDCYEFLIAYKSQADYGIGLSVNAAIQIRRKTIALKEIVETIL